MSNLTNLLAEQHLGGIGPAAFAAAAWPAQLVGVLVPLVTPWASLATLLWHERLQCLGVGIRWSRYVRYGCLPAGHRRARGACHVGGVTA